MLKTDKTINLNGQVIINETVILLLTATIPSETGVGNINQYVQNAPLYDANKTQIRRDVAEFNTLVYEIEDAMAAEALEVPA